MQEANELITLLKNYTSLRYIDPQARSKCFTLLGAVSQNQGDGKFCHDYVERMEEWHEKMLGEVSQLLNVLTPLLADLGQQIECLQQDGAESTRMFQLELREQQVSLSLI
jgi:hypothetical protein